VLSALEVAQHLKMSRSTTYRYLQSLRSYDLIEEADGSARFRLGARILELARIARVGLGLCELALPVMQRLRDELGEAVLLTRRFARQVVCIERVAGLASIRLTYERGDVLPLHAGASAKVLLAFAEESEIRRILREAKLPRFTDATIVDSEVLAEQLLQIRDQGYATSRGEVDVGVLGVAAPVLDSEGRVLAGLSVAGPAFRLTDDLLPRITEAVLVAAGEIGQRVMESGL
jgi:DNA-binding IclR family transcriptional regulator